MVYQRSSAGTQKLVVVLILLATIGVESRPFFNSKFYLDGSLGSKIHFDLPPRHEDESQSVELKFVTFEDEGKSEVVNRISAPLSDTGLLYNDFFLLHLRNDHTKDKVRERTNFAVYKSNTRSKHRTNVKRKAMFGLWG